ncbi:MAG: hypothetical protein PHO37_19180, partial [Kiritimatiellae bacterium]|nr:hypothetical protein [Kiritimatiellia bacterium]
TACMMELDAFALCFASFDQREGMQAFLEKRPPHFKFRPNRHHGIFLLGRESVADTLGSLKQKSRPLCGQLRATREPSGARYSQPHSD